MRLLTPLNVAEEAAAEPRHASISINRDGTPTVCFTRGLAG